MNSIVSNDVVGSVISPIISPIPRKPALSVAVTDVLRAKIEAGVWLPGQQVPTEKDLSTQLDVSRATIREALTRLKNEGYIRSVQGKGAFVADQPGMSMFKMDMLLSEQPADSAHIFELRSQIEQSCAALAAERRTTAQLREMKRALKAMRDDQAKGELGLEADIAFHRAIAQATGNPILARFAEFVGRHAREYLQVVRLSALKSAHRLEDVEREHLQIVEAIEARRPDAARKAVARHLANGGARFAVNDTTAGASLTASQSARVGLTP
jgi:GntR family transcriptional regulator, transcriptional repressor for pyruvate dehydrogenase complex